MVSTITKNVDIIFRLIRKGPMAGYVEKVGKRISEVRENIKGTTKEVKKYTKIGGKMLMTNKRLTTGFQRFHMEWLSVMFAGMALQRTMMGLLQPALQLSGIFEIWSTTLAILFLPIMLALLPIILEISKVLMSLDENTKLIIGALVLFTAILGGVLMMAGQVYLGVQGLTMVFGGLGISLGPIGIAIMAIVAILSLLWLAWQNNWGGIRDIFEPVIEAIISGLQFMGNIFQKVWAIIGQVVGIAWDIIKVIFEAILEFFAGIIEGIFGVEVDWKDIWNMISDVLKSAWNVLGPIFDAIIESLKLIRENIGPVLSSIKDFSHAAGATIGGVAKGVGDWWAGLTGSTAGDFIWRSGQGIQKISPSDNVIGYKGDGSNSNLSFSPVVNVTATSNVDIDRLTDQLSNEFNEKLKRVGMR